MLYKHYTSKITKITKNGQKTKNQKITNYKV